MSRLFALTLLGLTVTTGVRAAEPGADNAPERLLSPTSQLYVRWDGITAHADTYKKSFWGPLMAGPTGDSVRALFAKVPKLIGNNLLAEPLLDGKPPAELKATLADLKNASKLIDLIGDKGVVVGAEVREPAPTLRGIGAAFGGLLGGEVPGREALLPEVQVLLIVPDVGEKAETFFAAIRLLLQSDEYKIEPFNTHGRKGYRLVPGGADGRELGSTEIRAAWWVEGKHFVLSFGTMKTEAAVAEVSGNIKKGGVATNPLFARCTAKPAFTSVARGFADTGRVISLVKGLAGPFVPGLKQRIDDLGLGNLKAILFNAGYDGREFRAVWEIDLPGERKGLARILKRDAIGLADLPPMPPDVSRFLAARLDATAIYESGIGIVEALSSGDQGEDEDGRKNATEKIRLRREELAKEFDKALGLSMKDDLLPCLGDKVLVYQSPNEGLSILGTVVCVSLKDPAKAKAVADRFHRGLETLLGAPVKVRKRTLKGVEICELYSRAFVFVTPTYAIVGDWLVVSIYPQGVQGFVLRSKGDLPAWKPDAATLARFAKLPADGCALQYCDPTTTVKNLCCVGPLLLGAFGLRNSGNNEADFDPIDIGLVPNAHELSKHLFPNLTVTRDDGKTVRIEVNESFSIPLEVIGVEPLVFFGTIFGFRFF